MLVSVFLGSLFLCTASAAAVAPSCRDQCFIQYDAAALCQCDRSCPRRRDCCWDYQDACIFAEAVSNRRIEPFAVTDAQLARVSNQLWGGDVNRGTRSQVVIDIEGSRLFQYVDPSLLNRSTYQAFRGLLRNYNPEIGVPEPPCSRCRQEETAFIDTIMETRVMQIAWEFLADNGLASQSLSGFKNELRQYWFQQYSRSQGVAIDSSGFEHVFVGEVRGSRVTGFHNWVQFYQEEQSGTLVYGGTSRTCEMDLLNLTFDWLGRNKRMSSMWFGVSPEYEMAMFTICFMARQTSNCNIEMSGHPGTVSTFSMANVSPRTVGTAYPRC